ncbi:MAG: YkgJ family cysteine cluster protein [Fibrella sp.]|nr:YkgJ family cysteine cluster protein [Armatimonadota bacterium]
MPTLLPTTDSSDDATRAQWRRFIEEREALTKTMHLSVCNGCDGCGIRCTAGIFVTRDEYQSVQSYLATLPSSETGRVLSQNKTVPWPGAEDSGATVRLCQFRDTENNNCFVYPARPTVCRLMGQTTWLPCPIEAVPEYAENAPAVWNQYRRFERKTWEEWEMGQSSDQVTAAQSPTRSPLP